MKSGRAYVGRSFVACSNSFFPSNAESGRTITAAIPALPSCPVNDILQYLFSHHSPAHSTGYWRWEYMMLNVPGISTPYTLISWTKSTRPIVSATSVVATFSPFHLKQHDWKLKFYLLNKTNCVLQTSNIRSVYFFSWFKWSPSISTALRWYDAVQHIDPSTSTKMKTQVPSIF